MTRETKAGLVVSASFLFLVGVVLAMKLKGMDARGGRGGEAGPGIALDLASAIERQPVEGDSPVPRPRRRLHRPPSGMEKVSGDITLARCRRAARSPALRIGGRPTPAPVATEPSGPVSPPAAPNRRALPRDDPCRPARQRDAGDGARHSPATPLSRGSGRWHTAGCTGRGFANISSADGKHAARSGRRFAGGGT